VVKRQKYNLKASKATFESIKSKKQIKFDALLTSKLSSQIMSE